MASFYPINSPLVNYFFYNQTFSADGPSIPLAGGKVFFFADEDHNEELPTYSDVSDPNDPVVNDNPIELNGVGACAPFYLEDRLYYIVITGPDEDLDNPIWTIEHYHPDGAAGSSAENIINYIPNGQFLLHNDLPETDDYEAGEIREAITDIAPGGWTFNRPGDSTATDLVTFERYDEWEDNPTGNPRYAIRVRTTVTDSGDAYKDIRIKFANVNTFASEAQQYTIALEGKDNLAGSIPINVYLIKNFGTGGDTETEELLTTFNLTADESKFYYSFSYGTNEDKTIGTDNDDYVQLAFRAPSNEVSDFQITDFSQQSGSVVSPDYPETTQRQDVSASLGGSFPVPAYDGSNLGLPFYLTKAGIVYDDSVVGTVRISSVDNIAPYEINADGARYERTEYNAMGIPYNRLWEEIWDEDLLIPIYGTGRDFVSMFFAPIDPQTNAQGIITSNQAGVYTAAADGAVTTGFTFSEITTGAATINLSATARPSTNIVQVFSNTLGAMNAAPTAGTSGFVVTTLRNVAGLNGLFTVDINGIAASTLGGKYILFSNTATNYYLWFKYNGVGADPAIGGRTGILVNVYTGFTATGIIYAIISGINRMQASNITFLPASSITGGDYWTFTCGVDDFYVYYIKDGTGTDPALSGKIGIPVNISTGNSAGVVCSNTITEVNKKYFAAPDYRGYQLRVTDDGAGVDLNAAIRYSNTPGYYGDQVGTYQLDGILTHSHLYAYFSLVTETGTEDRAAGASSFYSLVTQESVSGQTGNAVSANGQSENNVKNVYVNVFIHI
jgi:hypothetical protein